MTLRQTMLTALTAIILTSTGCQTCPVVSIAGPEPYQEKHLSQIHRACGDEVTVAELKSFYTQKYTHWKKFNRQVQKRLDQAYLRKEGKLTDTISDCDALVTEEIIDKSFKKYKDIREEYSNFF